MKKFISMFLAISMLVYLPSCNTSRKAQGAIIGAAVGGVTGSLLTKKNRAVGLILGAAVGGIAGGVIGQYMDKAAVDISDELDESATVTRIGEGIVVSFDSGLLFDFDSYQLRSETKRNLDKLTDALIKYKETKVNILGHTDSKGDAAYNQKLSVNRAKAVTSYMNSRGITAVRLTEVGHGESDPVASNATEEGQQQNRRVEVVIVADESLKEKAKDGSI